MSFILNGVEIPSPFDVVIQLQGTLVVGGVKPSKEAEKILEECAYDRKRILLKEIELCQGYDTPMAYCLLADAYVFLGASYRSEAIYYLRKYLENPSWCCCLEKDRPAFLSSKWSALGKAYEGEYDFKSAILAYDKQRRICPQYPAAYIQIAKVMVKMNKLDSAIQFLQTAKKTDYYLHPRFGTCFNTCVDGHLQDIVEKKLRGYYYKPRKNKGKTTL